MYLRKGGGWTSMDDWLSRLLGSKSKTAASPPTKRKKALPTPPGTPTKPADPGAAAVKAAAKSALSPRRGSPARTSMTSRARTSSSDTPPSSPTGAEPPAPGKAGAKGDKPPAATAAVSGKGATAAEVQVTARKPVPYTGPKLGPRITAR